MSETSRNTDRETYCPNLQRLLLSAASELGLRAANYERSGGSTEDPNYAMLRRIGVPDDVDKNGRVYRRQVVGPIRNLERRWAMLSREQQETAAAHYLGTPRAHETLRATFGEFAGVVLHRWLRRQSKARERLAKSGGAKAVEKLDVLRAKLAPIDQQISTLLSRASDPFVEPQRDAPPAKPAVPDGLNDKATKAFLKPWRADMRQWEAPVVTARIVWRERRAALLAEVDLLQSAAEPLRAESGRLCAQVAALHGTGDVGGDETELLDACGRGGEKKKRPDLLPGGGKDDLSKPAAEDVRALHRAWYATNKKLAEAWVKEEVAA